MTADWPAMRRNQWLSHSLVAERDSDIAILKEVAENNGECTGSPPADRLRLST